MTHPRTSPQRVAQPAAPVSDYSDGLVVQAALHLSRLPPDEMRELVLAFRTFRAAHPRDRISLLDFAGQYQARVLRREEPETGA